MGTSIEAMPVEIDNGDLQTRYLELGGMAIRHARVPAGADMSPLLHGLPGCRCGPRRHGDPSRTTRLTLSAGLATWQAYRPGEG